MPDIYLDVDTAIAECPVNKVPLVDDTDFKSIEASVAYNADGLTLLWNFITSAGAFTQTAVTPTSGGAYDWVIQGNGIYTIEIPASGGASINNNTEGHGWFTGIATGVLPWAGPTIGFRAAALNDALIDGGDTLDVNITGWLGTAPATPTVPGVPEMDLTHVAGSTTNVSTLATSVASNTPAAIADAVWDEALSGHTTGGSAGAELSTSSSAGDPWSTPLPGEYADGTAGAAITAIKKKTDKLATSRISREIFRILE